MRGIWGSGLLFITSALFLEELALRVSGRTDGRFPRHPAGHTAGGDPCMVFRREGEG